MPCGEGFGVTIPWYPATNYYTDGFDNWLIEVVHFVNGSGHFGNSFFDPALLSDQSVTIPWAKETAVCENLDEPGNVRWALKDWKLTITIPKLGAHACVVIRE